MKFMKFSAVWGNVFKCSDQVIWTFITLSSVQSLTNMRSCSTHWQSLTPPVDLNTWTLITSLRSISQICVYRYRQSPAIIKRSFKFEIFSLLKYFLALSYWPVSPASGCCDWWWPIIPGLTPPLSRQWPAHTELSIMIHH